MAGTRLLVCNCQKSMEIDGSGLGDALGLDAPLTVYSELCRSQLETVRRTLGTDPTPLTIACTQEVAVFAELADEMGAEAPLKFVNIRERAGWCETPAATLPKMAALLADANYISRATGLTTLKSDGLCLVVGPGQVALDAARKLSDRLSVTLLLTDVDDLVLPGRIDFAVHAGKLRKVTGHLGAFEITIDGHCDLLPSARGTAQFALPRNGVSATCDLIVDLSGNPALFHPHQRRDGYLRADPGNPAGIAEALFAASDLVGEFEKPLYVHHDPDICAHSRSGKVGCSNCLDACPTGAITPAGNAIAIDPAICGGCGSCAATCPTDAATYSYPGRSDLLARAQILLGAYRGAGGVRPTILLHDESHGLSIIEALARFGRGLPANVIPLAQHAIFQTGHESLLAMVASGAEHVVCLGNPVDAHELPALRSQVELAGQILSGLGHAGPRLHLVEASDPDGLDEVLYALPELPAVAHASLAIQGAKRDIARLAVAHLASVGEGEPPSAIALEAGSPYGRIDVNTDGCTLCLSCVGACPTGAITDNPDRPQIAFTESACVQCGLCVATCPERVIKLEPRLNLESSALSPAVIKFEEPFHCVRCGKAFGTKSTVEAVAERLRGHSMFASEEQLRVIQMCDDCRVLTVAESTDDPFNLGQRPRPRTTDDYLARPDNAGAGSNGKPRKPDDFLS